ncbi:MAG: FAD-dependent oxidoreductase [Candidatus Spyradocola sp.]|nr:FAD-dependent oxidoreductase [Candidatus Spyradocola sp.]
MVRNVEVAIIGGGPAGLAAALAAHKAGAKDVLILERDSFPGGILQQCIHNGFGLHYFGQELTGPEYAQRFIDEVEKIDSIEILLDTMALEVTPERRITAVSGKYGLVQVQAGAVVLAMGCRERTRGALNIPGTRPAGVYTAGCAQRLVNMEGMMPGKRVVILGSGDIGLIMARRMVWEGAKVEMVCELMPYSSGLNRNIVQCLEDNNIPLYFNTTVVEVHGRERVEGVTIAQVDPATRRPKMETARYVECDTLLLSVGLIPENELTQGTGAAMDRVTSGAVVDAARQTTAEGIFACGNVLHVHDLVDNVSAEAQIAGESAAKFAQGRLAKAETVNVVPCGEVRYVVPQRLVKGEGEAALYFRVGSAVKPARLTVKCGETVLKMLKKPVMTPGEMEKAVIDLAKVDGDVTVCVEEG